ncbi:MAG: inositol monophosphatase family protein [Candidatus Malihini olakiniferum]
MIDPLDSTKELLSLNDELIVNIALIENSAPVLGVVYVAVTDLMCGPRKEQRKKKWKGCAI